MNCATRRLIDSQRIYQNRNLSLLKKDRLILQYSYPLSANPTKWSNTLKQLVGNLPTNCLSVFDHFVKLALKGLRKKTIMTLKERFA